MLSTVRSMPEEQIVSGTDNQQWLTSHLGFLIDERQMNVALTRTKHGLVIIGEYAALLSNISLSEVTRFKTKTTATTYRKIPIISPGLIFVQKAFLLDLFLGELIFGRACYWREFCVSKWVGLDNKNSLKR